MDKRKTTTTIKNVLRLLVVPWYLLGWALHVYLALISPETYRVFGASAIFPAYTDFWNSTIMPHITLYALLLAAFEITTGCLIASKGKWVKVGLVFSVLFSLFLIQMGLSYTTTDVWANFAGNRLPNILFIAIEIPLFWGSFEQSLPQVVASWFKKK